MRPHPLLVSLLLSVAASAQADVNRSLLRASAARAAPTWTSRTFEQVQQSVVFVGIEVDGPRGTFRIERPSSGLIVADSGLVVTWHRLVQEAAGAADKRLFVQLNDAGNTRLDASVLQHDRATGLALLQVQPPAGGLRAARLGPDAPDTGEPVLVVARPEGEEMLAFAGVASAALSAVALDGRTLSRDDVFLTDSRNDERCEGAGVFGADGVLLGIYAAEHVRRDVSDAELQDLLQPSFGVVVGAGVLRRAFAGSFAGGGEAAHGEAAGSEPAERESHAFAQAVAAVAPSVVGVWAGEGAWPSADPTDPGLVRRREGLGSGVVLTRSGLVVANRHVVRGGGELRVRIGEREYPASLEKSHRRSNLALLQVDLPAGVELTPAPAAADDDVALGEAMLAVGNPTGDRALASAGVISAMRSRDGGRIQADANLGNQNGGGAIVNAAGLLIGVADAGPVDAIEMAWRQRGDAAQQESNLSTFVGIRQVRRVFADLLEENVAAGPSILAPSQPGTADARLRASALREMVADVSGAMLNIYVARNVAVADPDDPFPPEPRWQPMSLGSGVIIDRSGLAVSNWHVVDAGTNADGSSIDDYRITARVFGGKQYDVEVLSISRENDLSLLQLVLDPGEQVQAVELGSSEQLAIAEAVAAIGNPHGRANTITYGVVSAKEQELRVKGRWAKLEHLLETDAAINGGNSGGALLDMSGRLVGINSAGGGTFNNKGYAIAVDHVRRVLLGLLFQPYKLRSPDLGMRVLDDDGKVLVMDVDPRGPAARAGVRSGDRLMAIDGAVLTWSPAYALALRGVEPGREAELELERDGARRKVRVAPVAAEVWAVVRQAGLELRDFSYLQAPERVRAAAIALHRAYTGDATGEPRVIPSGVVEVVRVFRTADDQPQVVAGDLILAVEVRGGAGTAAPSLLSVADVAALRDLFNDRELGKIEGVDHYKVPAEYAAWIERGGEVRRVTIAARRLLP